MGTVCTTSLRSRITRRFKMNWFVVLPMHWVHWTRPMTVAFSYVVWTCHVILEGRCDLAIKRYASNLSLLNSNITLPFSCCLGRTSPGSFCELPSTLQPEWASLSGYLHTRCHAWDKRVRSPRKHQCLHFYSLNGHEVYSFGRQVSETLFLFYQRTSLNLTVSLSM